jgi:hypothetical protein
VLEAKALPDLTTIGVITGIVVGVGGLALGIWNRIEQWREYRTQRNLRKPHFTANISHPDNDGWRPLQLTFYNPAEFPFSVDSIKVTTAAVKIAPVLEPRHGPVPYGGIGTAPNKLLAGQTVYVAWTIESFSDPNRSASHTIFCKPASDLTSFLIRVTASERSASRRKFHMHADAIIRIASP